MNNYPCKKKKKKKTELKKNKIDNIPVIVGGIIPIEDSSIHCESVKYVPVLAKVGQRHNVGGEGKRGGLLMRLQCELDEDDNYDELTLLQFLAFHDNCVDDENLHEVDMEFMNALNAHFLK